MSNFVFTNWDPTAYPDLSGEMLLVHIAVAALRYETVLIRDQDLTFNKAIAGVFIGRDKEVYRNLLEELFATGALRVNKMRPEHFGDDLMAEEAVKTPIRTRALFVAKRSSYGSLPFNPDEGPLPEFHAFMDDLLRRYPSTQKYQNPDANIPGKFKAEFLTLCDDCNGGFVEDPDFGSIRPGTLSAIGDLVAFPNRAVDYLQGAGKPLIGSPESPRSLVYHIADTDRFRPDKAGVERLAQSIFAAVYCQSEDAEGVFSHLLPEPPPVSNSGEVTADGEYAAETASLAPMNEIQMRRGIGNAIATIRSNVARNHFLVSAQDTFSKGVLPSTWSFYAEEFAREYARSMRAERPLATVLASEILRTSAATAGGVSFVLKNEGSGNAAGYAGGVAGALAGLSGLAVVTGWLSQAWQNRKTRRILKQAVKDALRYRYQKIELRTVKSRRASA